MTTTSCDLELAILAQAARGVYNREDKVGAGYELKKFDDQFKTGFKYAVYQNGNNIILSFAGTVCRSGNA